MKWADGLLTGFDTETTSADPMTCRPVQFGVTHFNCRAILSSRHGLIDPEMPIPEESQAIHHISDEMVKSVEGNYARSIAGIVEILLTASRERIPLVAMNAVFDLTILDQCCRNLDTEGKGLRALGWRGIVIDPLVMDKHVDKYRKGKRTLGALCEHYGVTHQGAHSAIGDTVAAVQVAIAIADKFPEIGNADPETLHALQIAWRKEQIRSFSEYRVKRGEPALPEIEERWPLMTDDEVILP